MGKLFLKKSVIDTLVEFSKKDYKEDNEDRPRAGSFKEFFEQTSKEDTEQRTSKSSVTSEDAEKK